MSEERWTVRRAVLWTTDYLAGKGADAPRTDAELMLADALGVDRVRLVIDFDKPLGKDELALFRTKIARRAAGEPLAYVLGRREFYGRRFQVDPRVLVPRPETEELVELALAALPKDRPGTLLDLCAGSGCVGLSIAAERPLVQVTLVELEPGALEVTKANAAALGLSTVEALQGDLFAPLGDRRFDVIVSNPPYVKRGELPSLQREVQKEPKLALDGGEDGLDVLRRLVAKVPSHLSEGGLFACEIGEEQGPAVRALCEQAGLLEVTVRPDWARHDRYVLGRRAGPSAALG